MSQNHLSTKLGENQIKVAVCCVSVQHKALIRTKFELNSALKKKLLLLSKTKMLLKYFVYYFIECRLCWKELSGGEKGIQGHTQHS